MSFTMGSLLVRSHAVPPAARKALEAAQAGPPEGRAQWLEQAARILHEIAGVDCPDARELVDLEPADCAG